MATYRIVNGPSRLDLMLVLFDHKVDLDLSDIKVKARKTITRGSLGFLLEESGGGLLRFAFNLVGVRRRLDVDPEEEEYYLTGEIWNPSHPERPAAPDVEILFSPRIRAGFIMEESGIEGHMRRLFATPLHYPSPY